MLFTPFKVYSRPVDITPSILRSSNYASIVINAKTGRVLFAKNADQRRYPASLTKMMTLYITFETLKKKKLSPLQKLTVSKHASEQPKSNIDLKKSEAWNPDDLARIKEVVDKEVGLES